MKWPQQLQSPKGDGSISTDGNLCHCQQDEETLKLTHDCYITNKNDCRINEHNCVLSNAGLSNAPTQTGICTSLKFDVYFRFHSPLNTNSALLNFICTWNLVLICWKMWSPEPENCRKLNPHTSKIVKLLPVCLTNNRCRSNHISEPHAKFPENR